MIFKKEQRGHLCSTQYSILSHFNLSVLSVLGLFSHSLLSLFISLSGGKPLSSGCWPVSHPPHSLCSAGGCCGEAVGGKRSSCSCLSVFLPNSKYQQQRRQTYCFFSYILLYCDHSVWKATVVFLSDTKMLDGALLTSITSIKPSRRTVSVFYSLLYGNTFNFVAFY